jgi:hypothetical protein
MNVADRPRSNHWLLLLVGLGILFLSVLFGVVWFALPTGNGGTPGQTLTGQVVDLDGNPVMDAHVVATTRKTFAPLPRLADNPAPWVATDKYGRFRLELLPEEPLGLMAYLKPKDSEVIRFPAKTNVEMNQKDIRIVLDPSLVEEDQ